MHYLLYWCSSRVLWHQWSDWKRTQTPRAFWSLQLFLNDVGFHAQSVNPLFIVCNVLSYPTQPIHRTIVNNKQRFGFFLKKSQYKTLLFSYFNINFVFCAKIELVSVLNHLYYGFSSLFKQVIQHIVVLPDIYWNPFVSYFRDAPDVLYT